MLKKSFTVKFDNIAYIFINDSFEFITPWELHMRTKIKTFYRFILAVFFSAHIFDFLFNPIWMHGYIWYFYITLKFFLINKNFAFCL